MDGTFHLGFRMKMKVLCKIALASVLTLRHLGINAFYSHASTVRDYNLRLEEPRNIKHKDGQATERNPRIIRVFTGEDGKSHFESILLSMESFLDVEGAHGMATKLVGCQGIVFRTSEPGYTLDWHTAPRRQYVIQLRGYSELRMGDGTSIVAGPGDVVLAEDVTGEGHCTKVIGDEQRFYAVVPLIDEDLDTRLL